MPNRQEMKPDRRSQEQARRNWRGLLLQDVCWAIFVAIIVVGCAKLLARFFAVS
jgi:hypothetical protein